MDYIDHEGWFSHEENTILRGFLLLSFAGSHRKFKIIKILERGENMQSHDRIEQLRQVHQSRRVETYQRVNAAIEYLISVKRPINFNSVALTACIAKKTLYNHKELRSRIENLRRQDYSIQCHSIYVDEKQKDEIIVSLVKRIAKLEQDNRYLREQVKLNCSQV